MNCFLLHFEKYEDLKCFLLELLLAAILRCCKILDPINISLNTKITIAKPMFRSSGVFRSLSTSYHGAFCKNGSATKSGEIFSQ